MDLRLLHAFIRIAELGSFGRAAEALNATQPTVSRQITALEQEVGNRLFTRHRRGVSLTQAGTDADISGAFAVLEQQHIGALVVANNPFFGARRDQLIVLAERHSV